MPGNGCDFRFQKYFLTNLPFTLPSYPHNNLFWDFRQRFPKASMIYACEIDSGFEKQSVFIPNLFSLFRHVP